MGEVESTSFSPFTSKIVSGYCLKSEVNWRRAPASRWSSMLLWRWIGPVNQMPGGTTSFPPPRASAIHGFGEGFGIERFPVSDRAKVGEVGNSIGNGWFFDAWGGKLAGRIIRGRED